MISAGDDVQSSVFGPHRYTEVLSAMVTPLRTTPAPIMQQLPILQFVIVHLGEIELKLPMVDPEIVLNASMRLACPMLLSRTSTRSSMMFLSPIFTLLSGEEA